MPPTPALRSECVSQLTMVLLVALSCFPSVFTVPENLDLYLHTRARGGRENSSIRIMHAGMLACYGENCESDLGGLGCGGRAFGMRL